MDWRKTRGSPLSSNGVIAQKCGVKFNPPTLILLYVDEIKGKQRRRSIPLRGFTDVTNVSTYIEELRESKNKTLLNSIPQTQLFSLLERIKLGQKCGGSDENKVNTSKLAQSSLPPPPITKSLNMASLSHSAAAENASKLNESLQFLLNLPSDGTQEDSSESYHKEMSSLKKSQSSTLKDPIKENSLLPFAESKLTEQQADEGNDTDENTNSEEKSLDSDKMQDLNKLTKKELDHKKLEMDVLFEANRVKPGDPNYQYDLEMDFDLGKVESGWDSNHSQSDF